MVRKIVIELNTDIDVPSEISINPNGEQATSLFLEALIDHGMAEPRIHTADSIDTTDMVMSELKSVTVGFTPRSDYQPKPQTPVIIDNKNREAFADILRTSTPIDGDAIRKKLNGRWDTSHCRAQIFTQAGTTDVRTAEVLANFYCAAESRDWTGMAANLLPDVTVTVFEKVWGAGLHSTTNIPDFIQTFRDQYEESFFIDVTWACIQTTRAMVEFCIWSNGVVTNSALTQYSFEIVDGVPMFSSIYNHSVGSNDDVIYGEDGTLQWTPLGPSSGERIS